MTATAISSDLQRYPRPLRVLHWSLAALVTVQFALILVLRQLESLEFGQIVLAAHWQCGMLILALIIVRFALGLRVRPPRASPGLPSWQHRTAVFVHGVMFAILAAQPLLGLLVAWSRGDHVSFLGIVEIPDLVGLTTGQGVRLEVAHFWLGSGLLCLIAIHLGAVLFNRLVRKTSVIERMMPLAQSDRLTNRVPVLLQLCFCCAAILSLTLAAGIYGAHRYRVANELRQHFDETDVALLDEMRTTQVSIASLASYASPEALASDAVAIRQIASRLSSRDARASAIRSARALEQIVAGDGWTPTIDTARSELQNAVDSQAMTTFQRRLENRQIIARDHDLIVLTLVPTVVISALLAFLLSRSILLALAAARNVVRRVEKGQTDGEIRVRGNGEFAELVRDIGRMRSAVEARQEESHRREMDIARRAAEEQMRAADEQAKILRAKLAADSANQAKSDFLANMSHELRTPLNAILGYAQLMTADKGLSERHAVAARTIHQSGTHLLTLITDILDLSKIEAGKLELVPTAVDLRCLARGIADMIRVRAEDKNLTFRCEVSSHLPGLVLGDEKRLRQVLINLLGNAIKFTAQGEVGLHISTIAIGETSARCRFEVRDTGVGIPPDELAIIFQPFEQVGATEDRAEGTGLGLSISRRLINLMGSVIEVVSKSGDGSQFFFELDLDIVDAAPSLEGAPPPAVTGYSGPRRTVLIVDDTPANRAMLVTVFGQLGFDTLEAEDGLEGLNAARATGPDLILMDIKMPVMDGYESMQAIRRIDALKSTPIIALSASATKDVQMRSLAAGADAFLTKPVDHVDLIQMMVRYLKLDWVTGDEQQNEARPSDSGPIVALPEGEIATLLNLAQAGNMRAIRSHADQLIALDARYRPFAERLQNLAQSFQSAAILHLIEKYATPTQAAPV